MVGKPKNGNCGLFGNLGKRSMQWSHNMLDVCRSFLVFLFNLEKYSKNAYKLDQSHILSFRTPKIVILNLLIL
jgi:hypothetical protein